MIEEDEGEHDTAEALFNEGKKYDWRQDRSPVAATLARANFEQAASLGHTRAIRALGHMVYDGRGGSQDKEYGILVLWSAFRLGDQGALEEVEDMLETYAKTHSSPSVGTEVVNAASYLREIRHRLGHVEKFMHSMARHPHAATSGE